MDLFNSCKLTSSPETSQVKHVGSSPDAILDQNQEHAKTLLVTPTDEKKNTSSRPIGHKKYNYGEKNHKNDVAQLSSFPSPLALLSFLKRDDWGRVRHLVLSIGNALVSSTKRIPPAELKWRLL